MSLRSGSRQSDVFVRRQNKYRIESDSEEEDDDDTATEIGAAHMNFGGVLASLDNGKDSKRHRKKNLGSFTIEKKKTITSPPLQKYDDKVRNKSCVDENTKTPPPKAIVTSGSSMTGISPLTVNVSKRESDRSNRRQKSPELSHNEADSNDSDADSSSNTQSNSEEISESSASRSEYEDSFDESELSSEFEFGVDDEEFIPEEDEDEEEENSSVGDFIVDDESEEMWQEHIKQDASLSDPTNLNTESGDLSPSGNDEDSTVPEDAMESSHTKHDCSVASKNKESNGIKYASKGVESAPMTEAEDDDTFADSPSFVIETTTNEPEDYIHPNENTDAKYTPGKTLPRKTLDFSSPEPQMAMILEDDDEIGDECDVLVATIVANDTEDDETVVLTFDDDNNGCESNGFECRSEEEVGNLEPTTNHDSIQCMDEKDCTSKTSEIVSNNTEVEYQTTIVKSDCVEKPRTGADKIKLKREGSVRPGKWALGAKIGVGSFGQVHVGMNTQTGALMAVKKFKMEGAIMKDIRTEVDLMRSLSHENIVRYLGAQMDQEFLHIFQEWVPGGSVSGLLGKFGAFSIEVLQSYLLQTLKGLKYLHENNIMHRDIKGSNILVNDDGVVKLADFGASKKFKNVASDIMMSLTVRGTPYFMAPEVFEEKYSGKADIWGIGCVAFQMATSQPPWKEEGFTNPISLFNHIKRRRGPPDMDHPRRDSFSNQESLSWGLFQDFVRRCFQYDPSQRPSAKILLDDPFLSTPVDVEDDESTHFHGIFSPCNGSRKLFSPESISKSSQLNYEEDDRKKIVRGTLFMSPPIPTKKRENSPCNGRRSPLVKMTNLASPSPDTGDWPTWARSQLDKQSIEIAAKSTETDASPGKISQLMDSLALSEDSTNSVERRSTNFGNSTAFSSLIGVNFLEKTQNDQRL